MAKVMSLAQRERLIELIEDAFIDAKTIYETQPDELLDEILEILSE